MIFINFLQNTIINCNFSKEEWKSASIKSISANNSNAYSISILLLSLNIYYRQHYPTSNNPRFLKNDFVYNLQEFIPSITSIIYVSSVLSLAINLTQV